MSEVAEYTLPRGWCWASVEDLTAYVQRGKSPKYAEASALPVVNQKCVRWHGVQAEHVKFIDPTQWESWGPERSLRDGDILWNSTGTGTIGRAAIYRPLDGYARVVADSHVTVVRVKVGPPEYLHAWIRSPIIQGRIDAMQTGSTNQVELPRSEVLRTRVPVAPLNEQRRIVAKLEALQARSRRAREALDAVPPLLEKLRQSILAAAFRGDLTKDWRAKHKNVEPASELLKRIRAERKKKWEEAELAKMKAKGKAPTDDKWKAKYKEPEPVDTSGLPELPRGWCWVPFPALGELARGKSKHRPRNDPALFGSAMPFIQTGEVARSNGRITTHSVMYSPFGVAQSRVFPRGTVCITIAANIAESGILEFDACFPDSVVGFIADGGPVAASYVELFVRTARVDLKRFAPATAQANINLDVLSNLAVPIPPKAEMALLVERAQLALARTDRTSDDTALMVERLSILDRSQLARAFRGELVPQHPTDEPADVMLARNGAGNSDARTPEPVGKKRAGKPDAADDDVARVPSARTRAPQRTGGR